jgi:hypothetical protein
VVAQIHARVGGGKFTGHVAHEPHLDQPFVRHRFRDGEDLAAFLKRTFEYALVFTTESPGRVNYYFLASDTAPEVSVLQLRTPSTGQTPATYTNASRVPATMPLNEAVVCLIGVARRREPRGGA